MDPPGWSAYSYFAAGWPFLVANLISLYLIHRLWFRVPRCLNSGRREVCGREVWFPSLRALRWLFGSIFVVVTVLAWLGWFWVTASQEQLFRDLWRDGFSHREWRLWEPPLLRDYEWPFYAEKWLLRPRWLAWNDLQFRFWRFNVDLMLFLALLHLFLGGLVARLGCRWRCRFDAGVGVAALLYMHGPGGAAYVLSLLFVNFATVRLLRGTRWAIPGVWALNGAVLVLSDLYGGFRLPPETLPWGLGFLSHWRQIHWHIYFKLSLCRLVSFACDARWARVRRRASGHKNERLFVLAETALPPSGYGMDFFLAYTLYTPLYLAGPLVSYNSFVHQRLATRTDGAVLERESRRRVWLELLGSVLATHLIGHTLGFVYYNACLEDLDIYRQLDAWEMVAAACFLGWFIYSKFYVLWTFFRSWAFLDGIVAPRNIRGCFLSSFTFRDFWRSWNVSMHVWVMRYIYQPLGGTRSQLWSVWIIFAFIGVWHDLQLKWAAWALFNCCCFCAEIVFLHFFRHRRFDFVRRWAYYELLAAFVGALDGLFIIIANAAVVNGFGKTWLAVHQAFGQHYVALLVILPLFVVVLMMGVLVIRLHNFVKEHEEAQTQALKIQKKY